MMFVSFWCQGASALGEQVTCHRRVPLRDVFQQCMYVTSGQCFYISNNHSSVWVQFGQNFMLMSSNSVDSWLSRGKICPFYSVCLDYSMCIWEHYSCNMYIVLTGLDCGSSFPDCDLSANRFANFGTGFDIFIILGQIYTATNDCSCWRHVMWTIQSADIGVVASFWVKFN